MKRLLLFGLIACSSCQLPNINDLEAQARAALDNCAVTICKPDCSLCVRRAAQAEDSECEVFLVEEFEPLAGTDAGMCQHVVNGFEVRP